MHMVFLNVHFGNDIKKHNAFSSLICYIKVKLRATNDTVKHTESYFLVNEH